MQVIAGGGEVATIARAVDALNLSLAHHAAWTDERFDKVDERFHKVDRPLDAVDERLAGIEEGQGGFVEFNRIDVKNTLTRRSGSLDVRVGRLEADLAQVTEKVGPRHKVDRLEAGQTVIIGSLNN